MSYKYQPYWDESTLVQIYYNKTSDSLLFQLREMHGEITREEFTNMLRSVKTACKRSGFKPSHDDLWRIFKEEIIIQCVTDWMNHK